MDITKTPQGNTTIDLASWELLIEDVSMILNQNAFNFEPSAKPQFYIDSTVTCLSIHKVYLCATTRTIRMEAVAQGTGAHLLLCLGKILNQRLLTTRALDDLICASRSYREDKLILQLALL